MLEPGPDESLDRLCGAWRIFQLKRGHRFSTDDLLTAWTAARAMPDATRLLDLGSGISSVGLMTLWAMSPEAQMTTIEVQQVSYDLAVRTVKLNGLEHRVRQLHGDLRETDPGATFELITGSPPYIPLGKGVVSPHPQRAGARMELKGSVFDYCAAAARVLEPQGRFVFCHSGTDPRPEQAITAAGLTLLCRQDVIFRVGKVPTIALFTCAWEGERQDARPLIIRDAQGNWTDDYLETRAAVGNPIEPRAKNHGVVKG
jgi:tRNA1(Val) A37 N6-methylase TrmN6